MSYGRIFIPLSIYLSIYLSSPFPNNPCIFVQISQILRGKKLIHGEQAGGDKAWLVENAASFRRLAESGDEDYKELVGEMGEREDLR